MRKQTVARLGSIVLAISTLCGLLSACTPSGSALIGSIRFDDGTGAGHVTISVFVHPSDPSPVAQGTTNFGGDFAIASTTLTDGDYVIEIGDRWWTGSGTSIDPDEAATVTIDSATGPPSIVTQIPVEATVTGVLADSAGNPVSDRILLLTNASGDIDTGTRTGSDGTFSFELAAAQSFTIQQVDPTTSAIESIGTSSYSVTHDQTLDVGTIVLPAPMPLTGTRNFIGGNADAYSSQPELIRSDMNPGYWASIESPGADATQGDQFSAQCYGQGAPNDCASTHPNPSYNAFGHVYSLTITAANPTVLVQVFDAAFHDRGNPGIETGDTSFNSNVGTWNTNYQLLAPDSTPNDPTDNPVVSSASCGGGVGNVDNSGNWSVTSGDTGFMNSWRTLCTLTNPGPVGSRYLLRVWTSADGAQGNAVNNFALRAIAAGSATSLDTTNYPTDALAASLQPTLAASHSATQTLEANGAAAFPLVEIGPSAAGHTLTVRLFDSGEGAQPITLNTPSGPAQNCDYTSAPLRSGETGGHGYDGGTIGVGASGTTSGNCTVTTAPLLFNGVLLTIHVTVPETYFCDDSIAPTAIDTSTFNGNGCWWSLSSNGFGGDINTWSAYLQ